jgi:hypothetical protein
MRERSSAVCGPAFLPEREKVGTGRKWRVHASRVLEKVSRQRIVRVHELMRVAPMRGRNEVGTGAEGEFREGSSCFQGAEILFAIPAHRTGFFSWSGGWRDRTVQPARRSPPSRPGLRPLNCFAPARPPGPALARLARFAARSLRARPDRICSRALTRCHGRPAEFRTHSQGACSLIDVGRRLPKMEG